MANQSPKTVINPAKILQQIYALASSSNRQSESGLYWVPLAANLATAALITANSSIRIINTDSSIRYITFSNSASTVAGTTQLTAVAVLPNSITILGTGPNTYVRSDSALVFGNVLPADPYRYPVQIDTVPHVG